MPVPIDELPCCSSTVAQITPTSAHVQRAESVIGHIFYRNAARVYCHPAKAAAMVLLTQIYRSLTDMAVKAVGTGGGSGRTSQCTSVGERKSEKELLHRESVTAAACRQDVLTTVSPVEQRTAADACRGSWRSTLTSHFQAQEMPETI